MQLQRLFACSPVSRNRLEATIKMKLRPGTVSRFEDAPSGTTREPMHLENRRRLSMCCSSLFPLICLLSSHRRIPPPPVRARQASQLIITPRQSEGERILPARFWIFVFACFCLIMSCHPLDYATVDVLRRGVKGSSTLPATLVRAPPLLTLFRVMRARS